MMPASWAVSDQSCVTIDFLEVLTPGTTFSFEIDSDNEIDILLFTSNARTTYQNEQKYTRWMCRKWLREVVATGTDWTLSLYINIQKKHKNIFENIYQKKRRYIYI